MKPRRPSLRRPFVLTMGAAAATLAAATACSGIATQPGGGVNPPSPQQDAAAEDAGGACPDVPPTAHTACALPNETSCSYRIGCSGEVFTCNAGEWSEIVGNPPPPICPAAPPNPTAPCDLCVVPAICEYGTCADAGANGPISVACVDGQWAWLATSCNPPVPMPEAGPLDAQTD